MPYGKSPNKMGHSPTEMSPYKMGHSPTEMGHSPMENQNKSYAKQERKDLFKDMSGGYNAMGDSNSQNYRYDGNAVAQKYGAPVEFNAGLRQASEDGKLDDNPKFKLAVDKSGKKGGKMTKKVTEMKKDPVPSMKSDSMLYKKGCISGGSKKRFKS